MTLSPVHAPCKNLPEEGDRLLFQQQALSIVRHLRGSIHIVRAVFQLACKPALSSYIALPFQGYRSVAVAPVLRRSST